MLIVLSAGILFIGLNSTSVATPSLIIAEQFHVHDSIFPHSYWPVTVWNTGAALGLMVGLLLLENFGIRKGYFLCYILFTLFLVPQAVAPNFATLMVSRAIAGALGGILQNCMEQATTDISATEQARDLPITLFTYVYVAGVILGSALGAVVHDLSWRWVLYIQIILLRAMFLVVLCTVHETRSHVVLSRLAKKDSSLQKAAERLPQPQFSTLLYEAIYRPAYLLCTEAVVFFLMLWAAFSFGLVFIMTQSVAQVYSTNYSFSDSASGLVQISIFVGETIGFAACLPQNAYYQRSASRNTANPGVPIPEARLPLSIPASLVGLAGGLFWYGWASFPHIHWMVPTIGLVFVGFGIMVIITAVDLYITDAYPKFVGSAVAAVALGENLFTAWLPFAAKAMYTNLGFQWASSLLGFVALALTLALVVLMRKGEAIRRKSKFISVATLD